MRLLIARHGNTFQKGEILRRVGCGTDLSLVQSGVDQAHNLGQYLKDIQTIPDTIYCSELLRTKQTAEGILSVLQCDVPIHIHPAFNEVDYGIDENKPEPEVVERLGQAAIDAWDNEAIVPPGWNIDPDNICQQWQEFANEQLKNHANKTILVVTSNGIARFATSLLKNPQQFTEKYSRKIKTGALCLLEHKAQEWHVRFWGHRP